MFFYDVDTQNDFMNKNGALPISGAEKIIPNLKKLTTYALKNDIRILGSVDRHFEDDEELKKFPPHCMDGTEGQRKIEETLSDEIIYIENKTGVGQYRKYPKEELENIVQSGRPVYFEKQEIDVATNPYFEKIMKMLNPDSITVYGVATDYCIKSAVFDLLNYGDVYLVRNAIKSIDKDKGKKALKEMLDSGVLLTDTKEVFKWQQLKLGRA